LTPPTAKRRCCVQGCGVRGNNSLKRVQKAKKAKKAKEQQSKARLLLLYSDTRTTLAFCFACNCHYPDDVG
jgi:hypothetical protein